MRFIYYSIVGRAGGRCVRQWTQSVRSVRRYNSKIPIHLFAFDDLQDGIAREADAQNVTVHVMGPYSDWLRQRQQTQAIALAFYPTLHKLLVLKQCPWPESSRALYLDCDTFFFDDPERLFSTHGEHDWYAREIPGSRLSSGTKTTNFDDKLVAQICTIENIRNTLPCNTGICLLSSAFISALQTLEHRFFHYAWRLMVGMTEHAWPAFPTARHNRLALRAKSGSFLDQLGNLLTQVETPADRDRAIPYPSDNWWILDEIAWLFALGSLEDLTQGLLRRDQVCQGAECMRALETQSLPLVAHYFSTFEDEFWEHLAAFGERHFPKTREI